MCFQWFQWDKRNANLTTTDSTQVSHTTTVLFQNPVRIHSVSRHLKELTSESKHCLADMNIQLGFIQDLM